MTDDLGAAVAGRADWTIEGAVAVYAPDGEGDWTARVRPVLQPERAGRSWHAAVLQGGTARHTRTCGTAAHAVDWAQRATDACRASGG